MTSPRPLELVKSLAVKEEKKYVASDLDKELMREILALSVSLSSKELPQRKSMLLFLAKIPADIVLNNVLPFLALGADDKTSHGLCYTLASVEQLSSNIFRKHLINSRLKKLLQHVAHGEKKQVKEMILLEPFKSNPKLLLQQGPIVTDNAPHKRQLQQSAYLMAIAAGDFFVAFRNGEYLPEVAGEEIKEIIENALQNVCDQMELKSHRDKLFPEGFDAYIKKKNADDLTALETIFKAMLDAKGIDQAALDKFKEYLEPAGVITTGMHFPLQILEDAYELNDECTNSEIKKAWGTIIGLIQRYVTAVDAMALNQLPYQIVQEGAKLKRHLITHDGNIDLPLEHHRSRNSILLTTKYNILSQTCRTTEKVIEPVRLLKATWRLSPGLFKPLDSTTKIFQPYKGYSEQIVADHCWSANVFCLPNQALLIYDGYSALKWDTEDKDFTEVEIIEPRSGSNFSNTITKIANSNSLFVYETSFDDSDCCGTRRTYREVFDGQNLIYHLSSEILYPICLADKTIIGFANPEHSDHFLLKLYSPDKPVKRIAQFDKSTKITGFYALKNNQFIVLDETGLLRLYHLIDNQFLLLNKKENLKMIKSIQDVDDNHFACSIFDNFDNSRLKIKDCTTRLQLWKKDSLSCVQELEIKGVKAPKLERLSIRGNQAFLFIGKNEDSVFIINFEKNMAHQIIIGNSISDFVITDDGKLVIVQAEYDKRLSRLIQIEPELIAELINQPDNSHIQTHIDVIKRPHASPFSSVPVVTPQLRKGYSEQALLQADPADESRLMSNVFCLPVTSTTANNAYKYLFLTANKQIQEINIPDPNDLFINHTFPNLTRVGNSAYHFIWDYFSQDSGKSEICSSVLFNDKNKICVLPTKLYHPVRLTYEIFLGIDDANRLFKCSTDGDSRVLFQFDKNKIISRFVGFSDRTFVLLDESGFMCFYELRSNDKDFQKISQKAQVNNIIAMENINLDYFATSTFDDDGNPDAPLNPWVSRIHLWKKHTASCVRELELKGYKVETLKRLPDSNTHTGILIGCDTSNIFIIDFEKRKTTIIDMDCIHLDFNIDEHENLIILKTDRDNINYLVEVKFNLLEELIHLPRGQGTTGLHINNLRYATGSLQSQCTEEKLANADEKLTSFRSTLFFPQPKNTEEASCGLVSQPKTTPSYS